MSTCSPPSKEKPTLDMFVCLYLKLSVTDIGIGISEFARLPVCGETL